MVLHHDSVYSQMYNFACNTSLGLTHYAFPIKKVAILTASSMNRGVNDHYNGHTVKMTTTLIGKAYLTLEK